MPSHLSDIRIKAKSYINKYFTSLFAPADLIEGIKDTTKFILHSCHYV